MIIRTGTNVQYTHDEEALLSWMTGLREFAGVSRGVLKEWIDDWGPYSFSNEYYTRQEEDGEYYAFTPTSTFLYCASDVRASITKVTLWKAEAVAAAIVKEHGFSCIACVTRTRWDERPDPIANHYLGDLVRGRQTLVMPPLLCPLCCAFMRSIFVHMMPASHIQQIASEMTTRLRGHTHVREMRQ